VPVTTYNVSQRRWQDDQASEDLPFWSRGGIAIRHHFRWTQSTLSQSACKGPALVSAAWARRTS
jgi:hypothetical protein